MLGFVGRLARGVTEHAAHIDDLISAHLQGWTLERLPAVDRAMSLFELLAESQSGMTLSQLSRKLDIPKSTAHYLLHTLQTRGYVQRSSDGRQYSLGLRFADVARALAAKHDVVFTGTAAERPRALDL